jgi:hypothetical protein
MKGIASRNRSRRRRAHLSPSFRGDAQRRARNPSDVILCGEMDSGLALRAPRNDGGESKPRRMRDMRILPVVPICRNPTGVAIAPKSPAQSAHPVLSRGAARDRHGRWERDAMDAVMPQCVINTRTNGIARTEKSCGSGAPTLALSSQGRIKRLCE